MSRSERRVAQTPAGIDNPQLKQDIANASGGLFRTPDNTYLDKNCCQAVEKQQSASLLQKVQTLAHVKYAATLPQPLESLRSLRMRTAAMNFFCASHLTIFEQPVDADFSTPSYPRDNNGNTRFLFPSFGETPHDGRSGPGDVQGAVRLGAEGVKRSSGPCRRPGCIRCCTTRISGSLQDSLSANLTS